MEKTTPIWLNLTKACAAAMMLYSVLFIASSLVGFGNAVPRAELLPLTGAGIAILAVAWRLYLLHRWAYCVLGAVLCLLTYSLLFQSSAAARPVASYFIPATFVLMALIMAVATPRTWKSLKTGF